MFRDFKTMNSIEIEIVINKIKPGMVLKYECFKLYTVKPHLSGPHLSGIFTYPDTCLRTNYDYILRKCLIYPDIQLSGQSTSERRCLDQ